MKDRIRVPTRLIVGLGSFPNKKIPADKGIVMGGTWDLDYIRIEDSDIYDKLHQFCYFGISQKHSNHFHRVAPRQDDKFYRGADEHLSKVMAAFKRGRTNGLGRDKHDEPNIAIGRYGQILLVDGGRTRAILAKMMGVKEIDCLVAIRHPKWDEMRQKLMDHANSRPTGNYQQLMHPDLKCIKGWYTIDRAKMALELAKGCRQFDKNIKTMIDVGTNAGNLCEVFEDEGFKCLGIELGPANGTRTFKKASNRSYSLLHDTNALDLTCPWKADVVLMLNILHHLYEESPQKLAARLESIQANRVIFTAPHHKSNFKTQDEFAKWVSNHIKFKHTLSKKFSDGVRRGPYPEGRFTYVIDRIE